MTAAWSACTPHVSTLPPSRAHTATTAQRHPAQWRGGDLAAPPQAIRILSLPGCAQAWLHPSSTCCRCACRQVLRRHSLVVLVIAQSPAPSPHQQPHCCRHRPSRRTTWKAWMQSAACPHFDTPLHERRQPRFQLIAGALPPSHLVFDCQRGVSHPCCSWTTQQADAPASLPFSRRHAS